MKVYRTPRHNEREISLRQQMNLKQLQKYTHSSVATQQSRRQYDSLFSIPVQVKRSMIHTSDYDCSFSLEECSTGKNVMSHCKHCVTNQTRYQSTWKRASLKEIREKSQKFLRGNVQHDYQATDDCTCCEKTTCGQKINGMQQRQFIMRYNLYKEQCQFLREKFAEFIEKQQNKKSQQEKGKDM